MEICDSYLEAEVRDGFYVPSVVKQAWAAELEVLQEVDRICRKYEIPYFADWGTLLGVVRHGGFIPWDDDLDITMKRKDYMRFLEVAPTELPEGFAVHTYATHPDFWYFLARVVGKQRICFEEEHLRKFHGFPYIAGVDIFVLDYVSADEEKEEYRVTVAKYIIAVADEMAEGRLKGKNAKEALDRIEKLCGIKINRKQEMYALRVQLYRQAEKWFAMFSEEESKELTRMMPNGLYGHKNLRLPKEYYDKIVRLPFEKWEMPVPAAYDTMLRHRYGDYMKLVRNCGGHDYPFFETQKKQLQAVLDFDMPGYRYAGDAQMPLQTRNKNGWKRQLQGKQQELKQLYLVLQQEKNIEQGQNLEQEKTLLQESQQLAIEMGTLIENCKGEEFVTVKILEQYCENLFHLSVEASETHRKELSETMEELERSLQQDIYRRKEAVFLPCKASEWKAIESVWEAAMENPDYDVFVMPIPYYYKEYDGALREEHYEGELFPDHVPVVRYDEFDFELHHPDVIYIQNAYDEYDAVMSVHTFFYSSNIRQYTDQLVYIPPFVLEEFSKDSYREYFNMQYYCTVPGVVNADKVIVQSENMKQLYIEKLTEFAGEDTRTIWEEKILGLGSPISDREERTLVELSDFPKEWQEILKKEDGSRKKLIMYHTGISSLAQYGERALAKMQDVFCVFEENRDDVAVLWKPHRLIETTLKQTEPELYQKYIRLKKAYSGKFLGILDETMEDKRAVDFCDAYYGDASSMVQLFRQAGKPVMMQNVEIM